MEVITSSDIEDLAARGVTQIPVGEGIVLTDLARDRAAQLRLTIVQGPTARSTQPAPVELGANPAEAVRPSASRAVGLACKPSGCLHSHIEGGDTAPQGLPSIPSTPASAQGSMVDRLVEVVRRLGE